MGLVVKSLNKKLMSGNGLRIILITDFKLLQRTLTMETLKSKTRKRGCVFR